MLNEKKNKRKANLLKFRDYRRALLKINRLQNDLITTTNSNVDNLQGQINILLHLVKLTPDIVNSK